VRFFFRTAVVVAALGLGAAVPRATSPHVYALRGAHLVPVATPAVDNGTIVIRGGRIESIGASASVPADADVIDAKGLTVYPGLIDLGNLKAAEQPTPSQPQNLRTTAELERWKRLQIFRPQADAVAALHLDTADMRQLPAAGITSLLAVPSGEVMPGRSALVNAVLPADEPQIGNITAPRATAGILKAPVALHVSFPEHPRPAASAYPESLMGVIAFVRQAFADAQHSSLEEAHYARVKSSERPALDPALDALEPALQRKMPVAFEANEAREIARALAMAKEFKLDPIVTGARSADAVADDLKAAGARVIYSLNFPQRAKNLAPDADEPLRVLRERADAPKVPAALAKAAVPLAFESAGLADPKEFLKNAARVVKAGLPADTAIRALTLGAATIAGAADHLGSLEPGKIANLVVTDGNLFDDGTKIVRVFVDGEPVNLDVAPRSGRGGTAPR
jgi:imidazolonepropionase-like amidohydrolase